MGEGIAYLKIHDKRNFFCENKGRARTSSRCRDFTPPLSLFRENSRVMVARSRSHSRPGIACPLPSCERIKIFVLSCHLPGPDKTKRKSFSRLEGDCYGSPSSSPLTSGSGQCQPQRVTTPCRSTSPGGRSAGYSHRQRHVRRKHRQQSESTAVSFAATAGRYPSTSGAL